MRAYSWSSATRVAERWCRATTLAAQSTIKNAPAAYRVEGPPGAIARASKVVGSAASTMDNALSERSKRSWARAAPMSPNAIPAANPPTRPAQRSHVVVGARVRQISRTDLPLSLVPNWFSTASVAQRPYSVSLSMANTRSAPSWVT